MPLLTVSIGSRLSRLRGALIGGEAQELSDTARLLCVPAGPSEKVVTTPPERGALDLVGPPDVPRLHGHTQFEAGRWNLAPGR
jgi:hypothetical protein